MTVSTTPYFSWSGSGIDHRRPPYTSCSPNLVAHLAYLRTRWGGRSLGCHVDPPKSTKSHPYGAALDWSWHPSEGGPGRARCVAEVIPFLIANSGELGVNTIHDYFQSRMWKSTGWVENAPIGDPGGTWLHIETTPAAFSDGSPVEDRLSGGHDETPGDDFMTPEDQAYLDTKFKNVVADILTADAGGTPTNAGAVADLLRQASRADEVEKNMAALQATMDQILAALAGAEFPVTGTVHIGTE